MVFSERMLSVERPVGVTGCGVRCGGSGRCLADPGRSCEDAKSGERAAISGYLYKVHWDPRRNSSRSVVKKRGETTLIGKELAYRVAATAMEQMQRYRAEDLVVYKIDLDPSVAAEDCTIRLNVVSDRCSCRSPE